MRVNGVEVLVVDLSDPNGADQLFLEPFGATTREGGLDPDTALMWMSEFQVWSAHELPYDQATKTMVNQTIDVIKFIGVLHAKNGWRYR